MAAGAYGATPQTMGEQLRERVAQSYQERAKASAQLPSVEIGEPAVNSTAPLSKASVAAAGTSTATHENIAGLDVAMWLPQNVASPPVIIFSHGFHGCNTQSTFMMTELAASGYAVFAPNHADAACSDRRKWLQTPDETFAKPEQWNAVTYGIRGGDIYKLLQALKADPRFKDYDWDHLGLAGHSLGGYTVLAIAGAWPEWQQLSIKPAAVLALSPYVAPFVGKKTLDDIHVPVMYQGGTKDLEITPVVSQAGGAYDQSNDPKFYVEFDGAGHLAWSDMGGSAEHKLINAYARVFFDKYLKDKSFPDGFDTKLTGVSDLRISQ